MQNVRYSGSESVTIETDSVNSRNDYTNGNCSQQQNIAGNGFVNKGFRDSNQLASRISTQKRNGNKSPLATVSKGSNFSDKRSLVTPANRSEEESVSNFYGNVGDLAGGAGENVLLAPGKRPVYS
ncbi:hypothetical protein EGW08_021827, partial [Elysia chlorotica]